ncbi:MAG: PH domain-containing protein [Microbacterium sp.]
MTDAPVVFRGRNGIVLTIAFWAIAALGSVGAISDGLSPAIACAFVTAGWFVWLLFWRPSVVIDGDGIRLRNILRDVTIPFSAVESVTTQFALTVTASGRAYRSWAVPAPSSMNPKRLRAARAADITPAEAAARLIRRGAVPATETATGTVTQRWQPVPCAISVALLLACVVLTLTTH